MTKRIRWRKRKSFRAAAAILIILTLYAVVTAAEIARFGEEDQARRADVIIVLGSEVFGDLPSPVFEQRILHGIWLFENGFADAILFTGGKTNGQPRAEAAVAKDYAAALGVPEAAILTEERSWNTLENFRGAAAVMEERGFKTAVVASDPYHMKRAMLLARECGIQAYSSPAPNTMFRTVFRQVPFLIWETAALTAFRVYFIFI